MYALSAWVFGGTSHRTLGATELAGVRFGFVISPSADEARATIGLNNLIELILFWVGLAPVSFQRDAVRCGAACRGFSVKKERSALATLFCCVPDAGCCLEVRLCTIMAVCNVEYWSSRSRDPDVSRENIAKAELEKGLSANAGRAGRGCAVVCDVSVGGKGWRRWWLEPRRANQAAEIVRLDSHMWISAGHSAAMVRAPRTRPHSFSI